MRHLNKGLVLHVGLLKTGSTTLQSTLFSKHSQLYFLGQCPGGSPANKSCRSEIVYQILRPLLWNPRKPFDAIEIRQMCQDKILSVLPDDRCLLGSWETLGNSSVDVHIERLDRIKKVFGTCRIIFTLRNPLKQVPSWYLQHLEEAFLKQKNKWMELSSFFNIDKWFENSCSRKGMKGNLLNYTQNIQASIELLGKENVGVFLFEDLIRNPESYYRSLSSFIDIDGDETFTLCQQKHLNKRITQGQLDLIRRLYSSFLARALLPYLSARFRKTLLKKAARGTVPARIDLTPELHQIIVRDTRRGHRWLVDNFDLPLQEYDYPL